MECYQSGGKRWMERTMNKQIEIDVFGRQMSCKIVMLKYFDRDVDGILKPHCKC